MWKKTTISLIAIIILFSMFTFSHAATFKNENSQVDLSRYRVNTPEESASNSNKKVVLVSGRAPEGTNMSIEVYGAIDLTGKNYTLAKLPKDSDYVLISSQNIKSGPAGFGEEIELIMGINKIIITFDVNGVPSVEKIIYYYEGEQVKEAANNLIKLPSDK